MYCPNANGKLTEEISVIEHLKSLLNPAASLIIAEDFSTDLLNDKPNQAIDFINNIRTLSLHPIITLSTRVTITSLTIIDKCDGRGKVNFTCWLYIYMYDIVYVNYKCDDRGEANTHVGYGIRKLIVRYTIAVYVFLREADENWE